MRALFILVIMLVVSSALVSKRTKMRYRRERHRCAERCLPEALHDRQKCIHTCLSPDCRRVHFEGYVMEPGEVDLRLEMFESCVLIQFSKKKR
mmetsp:Transcript_8887/g.9859  ORF Transcript_8887/g.9859 Transcript_8887/m.9859 type:complete len:93 (-) Transcript_8887:80-358(-)